MNKIINQTLATINDNGAMVTIRLILAYEFFTAGLMKLNGSNWYGGIQDQFPFPFNLLPADFNWYLSMGVELTLPILLVLGLGTRFAALGLIILDIVAWIAVHDGGYTISDGGFRLPLIFLAMLIPILITGSGRFGLDYYLKNNDK
ncbi:FIG035246: DoxX family protein [uncultured Gammaproteobacteria bacterium]|uniref:HvfX family Cu-binding RiPP maturation protein n=1 Tax=Bathymodiolus heckerae thiotrophic gill symbiont TaxID=1052212 RepID=UPI0010B54C81|nr:DoxX family protein [Bathymodiolus heckerae thiotrophic gill symbiont]CAC9961358.1 FIG035246: DoxX family protein [uncultured Gammaproteobacteria bacterium]SHN90707.1 FIG035246: DoxX family protein [Bathymodiolus heckerae thiotrophic gill symbiont]